MPDQPTLQTFHPGPVYFNLKPFADSGQALVPEPMSRVAGARVVYANYALLLHDFRSYFEAQLQQPPEALSKAELYAYIDDWLVRHAAVMSRTQAAQSKVNTPIPISSKSVVGYRPPRYGRAAIVVVPMPDDEQRQLLLDVKGCGVSGAPPYLIKPLLPNANGLLTLSEAMHELLMEKVSGLVLAAGHSMARPLPSYAVLDLGCDAVFNDGSPNDPAVLTVRRGHARPAFQWGEAHPGKEVACQLLEVELLLRASGLSSSNCGAIRFELAQYNGQLQVLRDGKAVDAGAASRIPARWKQALAAGQRMVLDGVNVQVDDQLNRGGAQFQILDFGRYRVRSSFSNALFASCHRNFAALEGAFLDAQHTRYVQPVAGRDLSKLLAGSRVRAFNQAVVSYNGSDDARQRINNALVALVQRAEQLLMEH